MCRGGGSDDGICRSEVDDPIRSALEDNESHCNV